MERRLGALKGSGILRQQLMLIKLKVHSDNT